MTKHLISVTLAASLVWAASSTIAKADPIYVDVDFAPAHVEEYPHSVYEGRPVYYVDGRWYYQRGPRWAYYRDEPRPLVEYRARPAYHRHYVYERREREHEHRHHRHHR
jgi:hypothetical protein